MKFQITPETKIQELLEAYPELEAVVAEYVPAYGDMQNEALKGVMARSTTLERAAQLSGLSAPALVLALREAAGVQPDDVNGDAPAWVSLVAVKHTVDATSMLAMGIHPIGAVREGAATLEENEAVRMNVPFRPDPLMAAMAHAGFGVHCYEEAPGRYVVLIARVAGAPAPQFVGGGGGCGGGCH